MSEDGVGAEKSRQEQLADDAVVAAVALAIVVAIGFAVEVDVDTSLFGVSAGCVVLLELLLSVRATWVRAVWERRYVRPLAVAVVVLVAVVGAFVAPSVVFAVLWGGLGGYLALAGFVLFVGVRRVATLVARLRP